MTATTTEKSVKAQSGDEVLGIDPAPEQPAATAPGAMPLTIGSSIEPGTYPISPAPDGTPRSHHVLGRKPEVQPDPGKLDAFAMKIPQPEIKADGWVLLEQAPGVPVRRFFAREVPGGVLYNISSVFKGAQNNMTVAEAVTFIPGCRLEGKTIVSAKTSK